MVLDPVETNQKDVLTVSLGSVRLLRENGLVSWTYSARRCLADFYSASTIINAGCGNTPLVNLTRYLKDPAAAKTVGISATKPVKELLGVFVPANGSPSIFMSPTGVLLPLVASHTASPTNLSP